MNNHLQVTDSIKLSRPELVDITGYEQATKQLNVLHNRGFHRAYINRNGELVLERIHYQAVCQGTATNKPKSANVAFLRKTA